MSYSIFVYVVLHKNNVTQLMEGITLTRKVYGFESQVCYLQQKAFSNPCISYLAIYLSNTDNAYVKHCVSMYAFFQEEIEYLLGKCKSLIVKFESPTNELSKRSWN